MEFLSESVQESTIHNSTQCCARWDSGIFLPKQTFSRQDQISPVSHYTQCSGCRSPVGPRPIFPPSISVSPIIFSPPALLLPFLDLLTLAVNKTAQCPRSIKKFSALDPHTRSHPSWAYLQPSLWFPTAIWEGILVYILSWTPNSIPMLVSIRHSSNFHILKWSTGPYFKETCLQDKVKKGGCLKRPSIWMHLPLLFPRVFVDDLHGKAHPR